MGAALLAASLLCAAPVPSARASSPALGSLHTPAKGSAERKLILDTARVPLAADLGKSLLMIVDTLRTDGHWAYLEARPAAAEDGGPFDWSDTPYEDAREHGSASDYIMVLLRNDDGDWRVIEYVIGPSDVAWLAWAESHGLPESFFQP